MPGGLTLGFAMRLVGPR